MEVLGRVVVGESSCRGDLSHFLPNLALIHGIEPFRTTSSFPDHALFIHHTALSGIGLPCLRVLGKSGVILLDNPLMCYADTVSWPMLAYPSEKPPKTQLLLRATGLHDRCANACPSSCDRILVNERHRALCWSRTRCQDVCSDSCRSQGLACMINNRTECCHHSCMGGCTGPLAGDCLSCKHRLYNGSCVEKCPAHLFEVSLFISCNLNLYVVVRSSVCNT